MMARIEEAEHGAASGRAREWLGRATHARRDPLWIADGVASDRWAPVSPVSGRLDAFVWKTPTDVLAGPEGSHDAVTGDLDDRHDRHDTREAPAISAPDEAPSPTPDILPKVAGDGAPKAAEPSGPLVAGSPIPVVLPHPDAKADGPAAETNARRTA
jgi:HemY protein